MEQKGPKIAESRNLTQSSCKGLSGVLAVEPVLPAVGVRGAPSAWRHSWKDSPHTHSMSHTPSFMWLQLFPTQITWKLWWWGLGYSTFCGLLCLSFSRRSESSCRNTQAFGKEADLSSQTASWEKWKYITSLFSWNPCKNCSSNFLASHMTSKQDKLLFQIHLLF